MKTLLKILAILVLCIILMLTSMACNWFGIGWNNTDNYVAQKIDDATNYDTIKQVEDTCRAMIVSYKSDISVYEQYKDSTKEEEQSWANLARMRANKTAISYNEYILKNSFVWKDNVPADISTELPQI